MTVERVPWAYWASSGKGKSHFIVPHTGAFFVGLRPFSLCGVTPKHGWEWDGQNESHCGNCEKLTKREMT